MINLTKENAEYVLGVSPTHPHNALEPAPLMDGTYVLPEEVLDDPANADIHDFLAGYVVPGDPDPALIWDFGTPEDPNEHDIIAYNAMKLTWSEPNSVRGSAERAAGGKKTRKR